MWIQKVIIFVVFCFESKESWRIETDRYRRVSAENVSDLLLIYKDLSILSRIVNAIALQSAAVHNIVEIREVVTEFLKADTKSFSEVVKNNLNHFLPILKDLEDRAIKLSRSVGSYERTVIDKIQKKNALIGSYASVGFLLRETHFMGKIDELFKYVKTKNTKECVLACAPDVVQNTRNFYSLSKKNTIVSLNAKNNLEIISNLKKNSGNLRKCMDNFKNYNENVKKVFKDKYMYFSFLLSFRNTIEEFHTDSSDLNKFENYMDKLKEVIQKTENSMDGRKSSKIGAMFRRGINHLMIITDSKNAPTRSWTAGFTEIKEMGRVSEDLKSEWFQEKISKGKSTEVIEKNLGEFFKFVEMMIELEKSWKTFQKLYFESSHYLEVTANKVNFTEYHSSKIDVKFLDEYKTIFKTCEYKSSFDTEHYSVFDKEKMVLKNINSAIDSMNTWTSETVSSIDPDVLDNFLNQLDSTNRQSDAQASLDNIRSLNGYQSFHNLIEKFEKLETIQNTASTAFDENLISGAEPVISKTIGEFQNSTFLVFSNCLVDKFTFSEEMSTVIEYVRSVLDITHFEPTRRLFSQFLEMRKHLTKVELLVKGIARSANVSNENPLFKLEKPKEVSMSFSRGVSMIHDMAIAFQSRQVLIEATGYNSDVSEVIRKNNPIDFVRSFWKNPAEPINKLIEDLNKLDKFAATIKNENLLKIRTIFPRASKVIGFPDVFGSVYRQLNSYGYSDEEKLRNVENAKKLSELYLDFSSHRGYLPAAKLSVGNIKSYFDDVFELVDKSKKKRSENAYGLVAGISISIFVAIGSIILVAYGLTESGKEKYKKIYLYYFPKQQELEKRWRYSLFMDRTDGKNSLLDAVREIHEVNVLKAVKRGVYINAYNYISPELGNTALHIATKRAYPKIVDILIRHGADRTLLNAQNKTPEQLIPQNYRETQTLKIKRFEKVEKVYKKYKNKKFRIQVPNLFPNSSFHIYIDGRTDDNLTNSFIEKFQAISSEEFLPTTTHCIVKCNADGTLETDEMKLLMWIFSGVIIMKDSWMSECLKNEDIINHDYNYLVENVKYNGVIYNTITQWTNSMAKGSMPYLYGISVAVVNLDYENISLLSNIVTMHGGTMLDTFPTKESYNIGSRPYLHVNTPPLFLIHNGTVDLKVYKNDPDKMYTLFTEQEFLVFMLKRNIQINTNPNPLSVAIDGIIE
ncbi:hypothetical protein GCK72_009863 [Caenorhabditis remanei]|uniref:BRCT domain-containing protein n=1 Tax=Caenorhabditis remanei TaxID=31234 RepID=A0A6A5H325_CAERE|nr:hypothetical protein GCK72_009863 [Caenorhabditis remanei]KAF1761607.1 hypothetical protein GCK72_009863 [Caenorhabditis remanei]